jgi:7-cyano-7-deazaguanine synthase in queuosine biosynthesis
LIWLGGKRNDCHECGNCEYRQTFLHNTTIVPQKLLDRI